MAGNPVATAAFAPALRLATMLSMLAVALIMAAALCGLLPDDLALQAAARARQVDLVAHDARQFASTGDESGLRRLLSHVVDSGFAVGAYARRDDGEVLAVAGEIDLQRQVQAGDPAFVSLDLIGPAGIWGRVGIQFPPLHEGLAAPFGHPLIELCLFVGLGSFVCFTLYL
ncbi:MAG: hypothetical protein IT493_15665, partial [Gammaproteobacteria bacterium]|nr:hypothetical protein [Gammaproteobacteria bacterium]